MQNNTTQHNTNATQCNVTRHDTQHNAVGYDAKQHSAMWYNITYFIDEEERVFGQSRMVIPQINK